MVILKVHYGMYGNFFNKRWMTILTRQYKIQVYPVLDIIELCALACCLGDGTRSESKVYLSHSLHQYYVLLTTTFWKLHFFIAAIEHSTNKKHRKTTKNNTLSNPVQCEFLSSLDTNYFTDLHPSSEPTLLQSVLDVNRLTAPINLPRWACILLSCLTKLASMQQCQLASQVLWYRSAQGRRSVAILWINKCSCGRYCSSDERWHYSSGFGVVEFGNGALLWWRRYSRNVGR